MNGNDISRINLFAGRVARVAVPKMV
jgi:hypothetical protein